MAESEGDNRGYSLQAKIANVTSVANLLKSIAFCEKVNIFANQTGLRFIVEEGKYVQACVYTPKELFQEFEVTQDEEEEIAFKIPLKELLDCLKIFCSDGRSHESFITESGSNTSLTLQYRNNGSPFLLLLDENGITTNVQLRTEPVDEIMDFDQDSTTCKIILRSDYMRELFSEIDGNGPEQVQISVNPNEDMKISGTGISGLMEVIIPQQCELVESFSCTSVSSAYYSFPVLRHSFKPLYLSQKFSLKMDSNGILGLSFLVQVKPDVFVEFYCLPQIHEDADSED